MDNYKKISVINEYNELTKEWDIKTIVIFRDGESPIVEEYDAKKHLSIISSLVEKNGFNVVNNGLSEAIKAGVVSVISKANKKEVENLDAEILQEQIKYAKSEGIKTAAVEEERNDANELSQEDRELAQYFRLAILRDKKQLPPVGLQAIDNLAANNERVAALEEAKRRLSDGRLSNEEYETIRSTYRAQLAEAIKRSSKPKNNENNDEKALPELNEKDAKTLSELMETIDLCREARIDDEKFEVVIDRGLDDHSKREVRVTLTNGFARDSYNFEFVDGRTFDAYLDRIVNRVSINDEVENLKVVPVDMQGRTSDSISLFTTKSGNQVLIRYGIQKEKVVVPAEKPKMVVENEKIGQPVDPQKEEAYNPEAIFGKAVEGINLSQEDRELADYFRKAILRDKKQLPPVGLRYIDDLALTNERVAALEEAYRRMQEGKLSKEAFMNIRAVYREQLAEAIKKATKEKKEQLAKEGNNDKKLMLSKDDSDFANYLRLKKLRDKGQLPPVGLQVIDDLEKINERVAALEEATRRLSEGKLSKEEYERINSTYRAQLAEAIKKAASETNSNDKAVQSTPNVVVPSVVENKPVLNESTNRENNNFEQRGPVVRPVMPAPIAPVREASEDQKVVTPPVKPTQPEQNNTARVVIPPVKPTQPEQNNAAKVVTPPVKPTQPEQNNAAKVVIPPVKPTQPEQNNAAKVVTPPAKPTQPDKNNTENKKTGKPFVAPIVTPQNQNNKKTGKINPANPGTVVGPSPKATGKTVPVKTGKGKTVKVKATNKLKQFGKYVLAGIGSVLAFLGVQKVIDYFKKPNIQHNQNITSQQLPSKITTDEERAKVITYYCTQYNVPQATMDFLKTKEVTEFLSQYTNTAQLTEVLSAICYGYEANILTTKDGNFRLDKDGKTYLRAFTSDFLCAKVVVNNYSPEQMLAVFGDTNVTYEQIMDGFKGYLNTVSLYGTTAVEPLPFRYLTNNDEKATKALDGLFDKLSIVNANRKAGTLNSYHTDGFIVAVDQLFVQNDQALGLTEGTKTVAAALVDSYLYSQAQVSNGEALYLHADYGLSKAGLNLQEVDGKFAIVNRDGTAYHFTSLLDVVNLGYGNQALANNRCISERRLLLNNLNEMHELRHSNVETATTEFANVLYQNGMKDFGDKVSNGKVTPELLTQIEAANPSLADEIDNYEATLRTSVSDYVPFQTTVDGVDKLLGIHGLTNDLATLHNIRRNELYLYNNYYVIGDRYVSNKRQNSHTSTPVTGVKPPAPVVTTTTTQQPVEYEDLTPQEQQQVQEQVTQLQQQEQQQHQQQEQSWEEAKDELRNAVENGATQAELEAIASNYGITLDPNYQTNMQQALNEQEAGEQLAEDIDAENERRNEEARREAEERRRREEAEQAARLEEQQALINGETPSNANNGNQSPGTGDNQTDPGRVDEEAGEEPYSARTAEEPSVVSQLRAASETPQMVQEEAPVETQDVSQTDPNRVDEAAGEEVYIPETKEELEEMRDILTSVDVEGLDLEPVEEQGRTR